MNPSGKRPVLEAVLHPAPPKDTVFQKMRLLVFCSHLEGVSQLKELCHLNHIISDMVCLVVRKGQHKGPMLTTCVQRKRS